MNATNLNGKTLNPLIDFDLAANTDLGLVRFIRENYQDEKAFNLDTLNKSDREILSLLFSRKNPNPLSIISTEENLPDIDPLYESFMKEYKREIISRSTCDRKIYNFIRLTVESGINFGVNVSIAVKDEIEEEEFSKRFSGKYNFIQKNDKTTILTKDPYYIKDYRIFTDIGIGDRIFGKKIYMQPFQYARDFFEENDIPLTSKNGIYMIGKDYADNGEEK